MATQKMYKRRHYFIDRKFQTDFILKFCGLAAMGGLCTIGLLYFLSSKYTTVAIIDSRVVVRSTADFILPILIQTVLIVMILVSAATISVTIFVSHKIAGPLYRLKRTMHELENGDFSSDFKIRNLDQLQEVAGAFNSMIHKTREGLRALKSGVSSIKTRLDAITEQDVAGHKQDTLQELKKILRDTDNLLNYFKT